MAQEIQKLTTKHRKMMYALCEGMKPSEVSIEYNITEGRLSILRRSSLWREEEKQIRDSILESHRTRAHGLLGKALDVMDDSLGSLDEKIALAAAKDIQNRTGLIHTPEGEAGVVQVRIIMDD